MESQQEHVICPHCGAENPKSLIVTTCSRCLQPLSGAPPAPAEPPSTHLPDRARPAPVLPPRPPTPSSRAPRPAAAPDLPPPAEAPETRPSQPELPHLLPPYQAEASAASRTTLRRLAVRRLGNAIAILVFGAIIFMGAQPDVRLRLNAGEVVGWVSVSRSTDSEGHTSYRAAVEPLAYSPTAPREFTHFSSGVAGRLEAACRARGVDPMTRQFPDFAEAVKQPAGQALGQMGIDPSRVTWGPRQALCRLRYAGLFRRVVYDFDEFSPDEEARLRRQPGGGPLPGRVIPGGTRPPTPGRTPPAVAARGSGAQMPSLHQAAMRDDVVAVKRLIDQGADTNATDAQGWTPLHFAAGAPAVGPTKLLLDGGADVNARNNVDYTPLHIAAWKDDRVAVVTLLLRHGADVNARSDLGRTPLHNAADNGCTTNARLLIAHGAEVGLQDNQGRTPAALAAANGHAEFADLLRGE